MGYLVGIVLGLLTCVGARVVGMDRDRAFYPTIAIIVASYYPLYAVMGGSTHVLVVESAVMAVFTAAALVGFRWRMWVAAVALAGHGVFDIFHGYMVTNPGLPAWWPPFCIGYDIAAGGFLAWLLARGGGETRAALR